MRDIWFSAEECHYIMMNLSGFRFRPIPLSQNPVTMYEAVHYRYGIANKRSVRL